MRGNDGTGVLPFGGVDPRTGRTSDAAPVATIKAGVAAPLSDDELFALVNAAKRNALPVGVTFRLGRARVTGVNCNTLVLQQSQSGEREPGVGVGWIAVLCEVMRVWEEG